MKGKVSLRLALLFSVYVFLVITVTMTLDVMIIFFLYHIGVLSGNPRWAPFLILAVLSVITGTLLAQIAARKVFRKIAVFTEATQRVARGDFGVTLDEDSSIPELKTVTQNFNRMTRELARTEILRSDFVENVSHEFKTPLSSIEGYATLLQKKDLPEEKKEEYTGRILASTQRLSTLTHNILLLSRIENQELEIRRDSFLLDEQIREVLLLTEQDWSGKNLALDLELEECTITANRELLVHVWYNLIENAVKFSPEGGTVRISLHKEEDQVLVTVADQGPGIRESDRERIFEKFYQADRSHSSPGNGLGLTLVRRITDLHGGSISLISTPGQGSSFTVCLPLG